MYEFKIISDRQNMTDDCICRTLTVEVT